MISRTVLLSVLGALLGAGCARPVDAEDSTTPGGTHSAVLPEQIRPSAEGWASTSANTRFSRCPDGEAPADTPFVDVSECAGIVTSHTVSDFDFYAVGQAWGDFDGDGLLDLYVTDSGGPNTLFRNLGDGTFEPSSVGGAVALAEAESAGATFVDYDNDGFQDLYVVNRGPNVLLHNERGRGFADVTASAGVGDPWQGQSASWADYDGDGHLDLYVANWLYYGDGDGVSTRDALFHNLGDGTFENVTHLLDLELVTGAGFVATFLDYDDDGDPDLYVANDKGYEGIPHRLVINRNLLHRNDGPGCGGWCFTEVGEELGAALRIDAMGLAVADFDGDLDLDIYVTNEIPRMALLENQGETGFADVGEAAGLWHEQATPWGTAFLDYDLDGAPDLFLVTESRNLLYRNRGDGTFEDVSEGSGLHELAWSFGAAYADYDGDGHVDLVVGNRGAGYQLFRNMGLEADGRHWLTVRLSGAGPVNRDAIGARVWIERTDGVTQMQEVKCGSSLGAGNDTALHFGLDRAGVAELTIRWPDGTVQTHADPGIDRELRIRYSR